jgi:hypothetical protein
MRVEGGVEGAVRLTARLLAAAFMPERGDGPQNPHKPQPAD